MAPTARPPVLGRYRLLQALSRQSGHQVFLAQDLQQGSKLCALKLFQVSEPRAFEEARREFEILRGLQHPGIAEVFDFGKVDPEALSLDGAQELEPAGPSALRQEGFAYLASVYHAGVNLRDAFLLLFLRDESRNSAGSAPRSPLAALSALDPASPERKWRLFLEAVARICEALDVVHARGLIHHDIKPENLLLIPEPSQGMPSSFDVKILDFGLAEKETTPMGTRLRGTFPFIAPEILERSTADRRSDLFSLGVSLFQASTGELPFPGSQPDEVLAAAREGKHRSLADLRPDAPPGWAQLVEDLIQPDPALRPEGARVVISRLELMGGFKIAPRQEHSGLSFPAVGWERELALVRTEVERMKRLESEKSLILLSGDSDQFLDRLADEVETLSRFEGVWVESGFCQQNRRFAYHPFADIIFQLSHKIDLGAPRFARFTPALSLFCPELIGTDKPGRDSPCWLPSGGLPPLKIRLEIYRFLDLVTEFFLEVSRGFPLVLCLRDLHLAGKESLDLLRSLARNVFHQTRRVEDLAEREPGQPCPILLVGTFREPEGEPEADPQVAANLAVLGEMASEPYVARCHLEKLSLDKISEWIRERAPRVRFEGEALRRLHEKSGGSTWFLDEFIRHVLPAEGAADGAQDRLDVVTVHPDVLFRWPRKPIEAAMERFKSLHREERRLLEVLAVAHGSLMGAELESVCSPGRFESGSPASPPGSAPPPTGTEGPILKRLKELKDLGFVELREDIEGIRAWLAHPKMAAQIYRQMPEEERAVLHREIAAALAGGGHRKPCRVGEDLTFHARLGGSSRQYIEHALLAAERLSTAHAYDAASQVLEGVLEHVGNTSDTQEGTAETETKERDIRGEGLRKEINERLASLYLGRGLLQRALEKLVILSSTREVLAAPVELASVYCKMGETYGQLGETANASHFLEKSLALLRDLVEAEGSSAGGRSVLPELLSTLLACARYQLGREDLQGAEKSLRECRERAAVGSEGRDILCRALVLEAEIHHRRSLRDKSLASNLSAMALAREGGDPSLVLEVIEAVGSSYLADGQYEKAIECFEEGLGIARSLESKCDMAACYRELGTIYHNRADPRRALDCFSRSLELSFEIGDLKGIATSYNNLGIVYRIKDDLPRAAEYYKQAIDLFSRINDQHGMAAGMNNLSSILELDGKYDEALDYAFRALDKRKKARSQSGIAFCYYRIGKIYQAKGELDKAYGFAEKSLQIRSEVGDKMGIAYSRLQLAELSSNQGKYGEAFQLCQQGLEEFENLQNRLGILMSKAVLARILLQLGEVEKARNELEGCLERARESAQKTLVGSCLLSLGLLAMEEGAPRQAEEKLQEAQRVFRSNQNRRELVEALLGSCAAKLESRDMKEAGASLEEAYSIMEELGIRDLVPIYFLRRGEQELESPEFDAEEAGKFLERGLVEARELNLPDLRWRFHYLQAVLEERRGDSKLSRIHFHEAQAILEEICKALPPPLRKNFYKLRERRKFLSRAGGAAPPGPRASLQEGEKAAAPVDQTPKPNTDELLALHRETLTLHEIAAAMGSEPDLQKLLESIMDAVLQLVDAERGFLILKGWGDDEKGVLEKGVIVARNLDREEILSPERKVSGSVSREVLETGKPVLSSNALSDTRFLSSKSIRDLRLRSLACVPLRFRREILGVIYLDNRHRRDAFRPEDMKILQAFADQAAVAVINARLIEENRRRAEELLETNRKIETLNSKLRRTVSVRNAQLAMVREDLRDRQSQLESKYQFQNIVGRSEAMQQILRLLERVSSTQLPILLEGESGTGKALIARAIHFSSAHKQGRFVSMSCGAVTESLLETELFGHDRGAFTGAVSDAKGLFELANGGTMFLDDVEDMSLAMQQKLLRVLQEGEFRRVGGKDPVHVSVRVISASSRDLGALVKEGKFREDLYYRLNGIKIQVPSLRQRKEDIPLLVEHFVKEACLRSGSPPRKFHASALRLLTAHEWPGNVRELRHLVERTLLTASGDSIAGEDLSFDVTAPEGGRLPPEGPDGRRPPHRTEAAPLPWKSARSLRDARNHSEKDYLAWCLSDAAGNVSKAAKRCRISRESLYRLLRKHGLRHGKRADHED